MEKVEAAGRSTSRLSWWWRRWRWSWSRAARGPVAERQRREAFRQAARADVAGRGAACSRPSCRGRSTATSSWCRAWSPWSASSPDIDQERFARLGAQLLRGDNEIRHIAAAPDLVITPGLSARGQRGRPRHGLPRSCREQLAVRCWRATSASRCWPGRSTSSRAAAASSPARRSSSRAPGAAVLGHRLDGDRSRTGSTPRPGSTRPTSASSVVLSGRDGAAGGVPFYGDPAILDAGPGGRRAWRCRTAPGRSRRSRAAAGPRRRRPGASGRCSRSRRCSSRRRSSAPAAWRTRASASSRRSASARRSCRGCPGGSSSRSPPRTSASGTSTSPPTS